MKKLIAMIFLLIGGFVFIIMNDAATKDYTGCYICRGKSGTYVKYSGSDTYDKRKKAKKLGCEVGGTTGSCDAANYTVLGTVN